MLEETCPLSLVSIWPGRFGLRNTIANEVRAPGGRRTWPKSIRTRWRRKIRPPNSSHFIYTQEQTATSTTTTTTNIESEPRDDGRDRLTRSLRPEKEWKLYWITSGRIPLLAFLYVSHWADDQLEQLRFQSFIRNVKRDTSTRDARVLLFGCQHFWIIELNVWRMGQSNAAASSSCSHNWFKSNIPRSKSKWIVSKLVTLPVPTRLNTSFIDFVNNFWHL